MIRVAIAVLASLVATSALAAVKPCEELKAEIEAKIQAQGVSSYTLEIVPNSEVKDQNMVVGTCDGGTKKIIYQKNERYASGPGAAKQPHTHGMQNTSLGSFTTTLRLASYSSTCGSITGARASRR